MRACVRGWVGKGTQEGGRRVTHRNGPDVRGLLRCGSLPRPRRFEGPRKRRARGRVEVGKAERYVAEFPRAPEFVVVVIHDAACI